MAPTLRIAISGGGVAGASLLQALLNYSHLDPHIFESAPQFREAGVAFGLARNATAALSLIGPEAIQALKDAGGVPMVGVRFFLGQGPHAGEMVFEADNEAQGKETTTIVQRANFLRALLTGIPEERLHASKKLQTADRRADGSLLLHFADGSTHECDVLIGADGIHSTVRKIVLGHDDPAAKPRNSGSWAIMKLMPYDEARAAIDAPVDLHEAREHAWVLDHTMILHNITSNGDLVQYLVCGYDEDAAASELTQRSVTKEQLQDRSKGKAWLPHLEKSVNEILCKEPQQDAWYIWEHPPARTYFDGSICIMGDAAHATTPFQGSGGGMCIEDSMILSTLLGRTDSREEVATALSVYSRSRLERTQRVVKSSWQTGRIFFGVHEDTGFDPEKLKAVMGPRWDFIIDFDNAQARDEAVAMFDAEVKQAKNC